MFIKILTVFNLYKLIDFIEENHRERYRVHPSLKRNKFDYCDEFEKVWASIDRPRESGRKEQGHKVFLKLKNQLAQANEKLERAVNLIQKYVDSGEGIYFYDSEAMCEFLKEQGADFSVKERHFSEQKMAKRLNHKREE